MIKGGSPPHTRGIQQHSPPGAFHGGFTPAYAGNTIFEELSPLTWQVHPRIRGEYATRPGTSARTLGSPPHTRGIQGIRPPYYCLPRFTPAYAGNTD